MHGFQIFEDGLFKHEAGPGDPFHLPLDWNEELTLEEYLERVKAQSDKMLK